MQFNGRARTVALGAAGLLLASACSGGSGHHAAAASGGGGAGTSAPPVGAVVPPVPEANTVDPWTQQQWATAWALTGAADGNYPACVDAALAQDVKYDDAIVVLQAAKADPGGNPKGDLTDPAWQQQLINDLSKTMDPSEAAADVSEVGGSAADSGCIYSPPNQ
jgi:hypothetical protein